MEKLLITLATVDYNTTAVAGAWEIDNLTNGELLAMDQEGTAVDMLAPAIATDEMYFAVGRTSGGSESTVMVNIDSLEWTKQAYVAPVAKTMYIGDDNSSNYGLHLPTPLVTGDVVGIRLIDKTKYQYDAERIVEVEYQVADGDTTATVKTNLTTACNANARFAAIVTVASSNAAVGNLGMSLTGVTAGDDFTAVPYGILEDADVVQYQNVNGVYTVGETTPNAIVVGYGTSTQLTAIESDYGTHDGDNHSYYMGSDLYSKATNVVAGATYTLYTLMWRKKTNKNLIDEGNIQQTLVVAIPSGETGAAESVTAMDNILASL